MRHRSIGRRWHECSLGQIKCSLRILTGFLVCSGLEIAWFGPLSRHQKAVCPWLKSTNEQEVLVLRGVTYFVHMQQCYKPYGLHAVHLPPSISLSSLSLFRSPLFSHVQPFRSPSSITSITLLTHPSLTIYKQSVSIRLYHFHHGESRSHPSSAPSGGRVHSAAKRVGASAYWVEWMDIKERCVHAQQSVV